MPTSISDPHRLKALVAQRAEALGFAGMRVTRPEVIADEIGLAGRRLMAFLAEGRHGSMGWMETTAERRADPRVLWPEVRSILVLGFNYGPDQDPLLALGDRQRGVISAYAKGRDYHDVIKGRLKDLAGLIGRESGADVRVFVDTAPLMEKPLAQGAGLGWQGKHTNLVSRQSGSWLFLGLILTAFEFPADEREQDHCGSCSRCLDVCPTKAFPAPYQLDARRCIAYLTIEHQGHIAAEFRAAMGNRIYGCDDCLAVCPWNKFAQAASEARFAASPATDNPPLADLLGLDDADFRARYAGSPIKRTGRDRFLRNCLIAAGNSGDLSLRGAVAALLSDGSPLVRAMAVWALGRLSEPEDFQRLKDLHCDHEPDADVRAEWQNGTTS